MNKLLGHLDSAEWPSIRPSLGNPSLPGGNMMINRVANPGEVLVDSDPTVKEKQDRIRTEENNPGPDPTF